MTNRIPAYKPHPNDTIQTRLVHSLTRYDRQQEQRRGHNPYALGQYLARVDLVISELANGADLRSTLVRSFSGHLLDVVLKACDLEKATREELRG